MPAEKTELNMDDPKHAGLTVAIKEFSSFRFALRSESDRGCALFAAAYLDKALAELIKACLVQNPHVENDLFSGQSGLSTFSSRIKLAYYLGKISPSERKDLDTIRNIRNDFAHHAESLDFDDQSIRDRCSNLQHNWRETEASPRAKFCSGVSSLLLRIETERLTATAPNEAIREPLPEHIKKQSQVLRAKLEDIIQSASNDEAPTAE